ncbi:MAG TPA: methyltransferase domain-containing protein [Chloroflexota bacterium]|nr:methyltransferase domain-containing protein [Chloroflexota bacterium]
MTPEPAANAWDAEAYDRTVSIVTRLGASVLDLLAPKAGLRVLDLGCGTGHLTAQIAAAGAEVMGIDAAPSMIERARALYPHLRFAVGRGEDFTLDAPVDAVFSNAALHWMTRPAAVAACVARALVPGGRFVAEMGGRGNVATVVAALGRALVEEGVPPAAQPRPWYFPSIPEYAALLEQAGFEVTFMHLFDRPTPLDDCPHGPADWVRMFGGPFLDAVPPDRRDAVAARVSALVRPTLYRDGHWIADYRRLRFVAVRR